MLVKLKAEQRFWAFDTEGAKFWTRSPRERTVKNDLAVRGGAA